MTAQGHPRAIFKRAIRTATCSLPRWPHGNSAGSLSASRSRSGPSAVQKEPARRSRYTVRWLRRLLEEDECLTIDEAALAVSALAALGGRGHAEALSALSTMAERATGQRPRGP